MAINRLQIISLTVSILLIFGWILFLVEFGHAHRVFLGSEADLARSLYVILFLQSWIVALGVPLVVIIEILFTIRYYKKGLGIIARMAAGTTAVALGGCMVPTVTRIYAYIQPVFPGNFAFQVSILTGDNIIFSSIGLIGQLVSMLSLLVLLALDLQVYKVKPSSDN